jgi:hypothetical protein
MATSSEKGPEPKKTDEVPCEVCGLRFRTEEALEVHRGSSHSLNAKSSRQENEALTFAPGGTVADFETGPRPGGKMDRETSRPAKRWETPGEGGDPRRGPRNEGVAPIEVPVNAAGSRVSEGETPGASPSGSKKPRRKSAQ